MPKSRKRTPRAASSISGDGGGANEGGGPTKATAKPVDKVGPIQFIAQTRQEARKVTWTSWRETMTTTILVLIMVVLFGLFFFVVDFVLGSGTKAFLEFFGAGASSSTLGG